MVQTKTKYAKSGSVNIAYQVVGEGPLDLVLVPGWFSHVELAWESYLVSTFYERLASFSRLILFDKRGTGLSDRVPIHELPTLEERMDDVRAVMEAVNSRQAALFGLSEGGPMSALFAATYPERTSALIMYGSFAKAEFDDILTKFVADTLEKFEALVEERWADGFPGLDIWAPTIASSEEAQKQWARSMRLAASPSAAVALIRMDVEIDTRHVLPAIHVPSLILHRTGDLAVGVSHSRYLAEHIPGAKYVELPGVDHLPWIGDSEAIIGEIEEFLTGTRHKPETDRVLATVLFTDIVDSTEQAAHLGDRVWRKLLNRYHALVRRELDRFRGREVDTAGDGVFATFDGPGRAIRCALSIREMVHSLGLKIRAGLHTGECELSGSKVTGIAVHIGARVLEKADPNEVLVSSTTKDLVVGSGIQFQDRGSHLLKGVPGEWHLFTVI